MIALPLSAAGSLLSQTPDPALRCFLSAPRRGEGTPPSQLAHPASAALFGGLPPPRALTARHPGCPLRTGHKSVSAGNLEKRSTTLAVAWRGDQAVAVPPLHRHSPALPLARSSAPGGPRREEPPEAGRIPPPRRGLSTSLVMCWRCCCSGCRCVPPPERKEAGGFSSPPGSQRERGVGVYAPKAAG